MNLKRLSVSACLLFALAASAQSEARAGQTFVHNLPFATHNIVLQVSQNDPERWELALNNAQNLLNHYGADRVRVVVVAFGPGLHMLYANSPVASRVTSENAEGIEFDACGNTLRNMAEKSKQPINLNQSAVVVPSGVARIGELELDGFSYIKP